MFYLNNIIFLSVICERIEFVVIDVVVTDVTCRNVVSKKKFLPLLDSLLLL
jgi:hypothetical protein